ncbi:MAG: RagB/SusD family nutrient uptake outer membrane protein [Odoribacter sp.]|nr:RagB/SusD family nutrient uptake outer membrane protein [Odoribacter sp.]
MKTKIHTLALFGSLLLASCGNWLDVLPKSEVDENEMFETANGYYSSLTGIYINMASADLYGGNLTLTLTEPLGQQYAISNNEPEREKWKNFDYTTTTAEKNLLTVWSKMYNNIVNCNLLIDRLREEKRHLFEAGGKEILLSEALGLRAYMYFDLIRMFNESPNVNPESQKVPYKTDFGLSIGTSFKTREIVDYLLNDLTEAQKLLETHDPVVSGKSYRDKYLNYNRNQRMNYYAVCGLMARIYLYMGNYRKAYDHAAIVINSGKFRFIEENEIIETDRYGNELKADRLFVPELLFGLYSESILDVSRTRYEGLIHDFILSTNCYGSGDLRLDAWYADNQMNKINLIKYKRSSNTEDNGKYEDPQAPMLKLGEMYLIASEAVLNDPSINDNALDILNTFKQHRKTMTMAPDATDTEIAHEITREYICEFRGEGQLFWYYKRTNQNRIDNGNYRGTTIPVDINAYTFPLPQYEIDFGTGSNH